MGLFDWPAPAFTTLDDLMGDAIGPFGRVLIWGLLCAVISMVLYRVLSPQTRIKQIKADVKTAQKAMTDDDGEDFAHGMRLARAQPGHGRLCDRTGGSGVHARPCHDCLAGRAIWISLSGPRSNRDNFG